MSSELWSASWRGRLVPDVTATHNLRFRFNESCRVFIDGVLVIDAWYTTRNWHDEYVDVPLVAGQPVALEVHYRQRFRCSGIRMLWKSTPEADPANKETAYTHIPTSNLLPPLDLEAPSKPGTSKINFLTETRAQLNWGESTDDVQISHYNIYRDRSRIGTSLTTSFIDTGAAKNDDARYHVEAIDWTGKISVRSERGKTWQKPKFVSDRRSYTSPAWVEGTVGPNACELQVAINESTPIPALRLGDTLWGVTTAGSTALGVPLSPTESTTVAVTATTTYGQTATATQRIRWQTTTIDFDDTDEVIIRAGDSLLFDVDAPRRSTVGIDVDGDGEVDYTGEGSDEFPVLFSQPGTYEVVAASDENGDGELDTYTEQAGFKTVTVIDINFDGPIACEVGFEREKGVEVYPLSHAGTPIWTSNNEGLLSVSVIPDDELSEEVLANPDYNPTNYGKRLYLESHLRGSPIVMARVPGSNAVIKYQEVDEFTQGFKSQQRLLLNADNRVGTTRYMMQPFVPDLDVTFEMFSHSSTFAGGVTEFTMSTNDFEVELNEETGEYVSYLLIDIEVPEDDTSYCFSVNIDQESAHGSAVSGRWNENGDTCEVQIGPITICLDWTRTLTAKITKTTDDHESTQLPLSLLATDAWFNNGSADASQQSEKIIIDFSDAEGTTYSDLVHADLFDVDVMVPECGVYDGIIDDTEFPEIVEIESCLDSVTVTDATVANGESATNPGKSSLEIFVNSDGEAFIDIDVEGGSRTASLFILEDEDGDEIDSGFLPKSNAKISIPPSECEYTYTVTVGVDCNRNDELDEDEEEYSLDVILKQFEFESVTIEDVNNPNRSLTVNESSSDAILVLCPDQKCPVYSIFSK
jgi:hypothetical protein